MCRFLAYLGHSPVGIGQLIAAPSNSLINQSHARRGSTGGINGDGFGLAWYNNAEDLEPGLFKSIQPAWNDANLRHLSRKISSPCFMAHVRASTVGDVSQDNCHPFSYGRYTFVHNGTIHFFNGIKRDLMAQLRDEKYLRVRGQTDSEHLFFLIMQYLEEEGQDLEKAVLKAFTWVLRQQEAKDRDHFSRLNILISDGTKLIATRFASKQYEPISLHYSLDNMDLFPDLAQFGKEKKSVVIASEALDENRAAWLTVPANHYMVVTGRTLELAIHPLQLEE